MRTQKTPKVVLRFEKLKTWGEIGAAVDHNLRKRPTPNAAGKFIVIKGPEDDDVVNSVREIIGKQTIRKNAVLAVEVLIGASPEYFRPSEPEKYGVWEPEKLAAWRNQVEPWISQKFPFAASVVLHLDEATPHFQVIDVPLSPEGKLNSRGKYGGKASLVNWQDEAAKPVADLGIARGIPGSLAIHERIKAFYSSANAPMPVLPMVRSPKPKPLAPASIMDLVPFSEAKSRREKLEADHAAALSKHLNEVKERNRTVLEVHSGLVEKANIADIAQRQKVRAEMTAEKALAALAGARLQSDRIRELSLSDVLRKMYDATEVQKDQTELNSREFNLADGRNIFINGASWCDKKEQKSGTGAIALVMHLDSIELKTAIRLMAETFEASILAAEHALQLVAQTEKEIAEISRTGSVPLPAINRQKLPHVLSWMEKLLCFPKKLVKWVYENDLVFADGSGNAVFKRQPSGAVVVGTSSLMFQRTIGKPNCGAFIVPPAPDKKSLPDAVYLVEDPLDAIAITACKPSAGVIACGGKLLPLVHLKKGLPKDVTVYAAFRANIAGERLASEAHKELGAIRYALPSGIKNWVDAIKVNPKLISVQWINDDIVTGTSTQIASSKPRRPMP